MLFRSGPRYSGMLKYPSLNSLGKIYLERGKYKEAYDNFVECLEARFNASGINIGLMYEQGIIPGEQQDYRMAVHYFREAEKNYDTTGIYHLARFYENGIYFKRNIHKAIKLYEICADDNEPHGMSRLGQFYEDGLIEDMVEIIEPDIEKAVYWYRRASRKGNSLAHKRLRAILE